MSRRGFTLIELLLYVGLTAAMLLVVSVFLTTLLAARVKNQTIAEVEQAGLQVMQIITQTARNAQGITAPTTGTSAASLTLDVATVADDPTVFDLASGAIRITEGVGSPVDLTATNRLSASGLLFTNVSQPSTEGAIKIEFTLTHLNPSGGRQEFEYAKTFYGTAALRNN